MRNALVHDYLNINPEIIEQLIRENEYSSLVAFAQEELVAQVARSLSPAKAGAQRRAHLRKVGTVHLGLII